MRSARVLLLQRRYPLQRRRCLSRCPQPLIGTGSQNSGSCHSPGASQPLGQIHPVAGKSPGQICLDAIKAPGQIRSRAQQAERAQAPRHRRHSPRQSPPAACRHALHQNRAWQLVTTAWQLVATSLMAQRGRRGCTSMTPQPAQRGQRSCRRRRRRGSGSPPRTPSVKAPPLLPALPPTSLPLPALRSQRMGRMGRMDQRPPLRLLAWLPMRAPLRWRTPLHPPPPCRPATTPQLPVP
jgi:hypothetical protein